MTQSRSKARPRAWLVAAFVFAILFWWLALATPDEAEDNPIAGVVAVAAPDPLPQPRAATAPSVLTAQQRLQPAPAPASAPAAAALPSPAASPEPATRAPIPPDTRGFIDAIQGRYEEDTRDNAAASVETALQAFFRSTKLPASALRSVVCKQDVCKLELYWRAEYDEAYRGAIVELTDGNAKTVATRAEEPDKTGGVSVNAYWLRRLSNGDFLRRPP